MDKQTTPSKSDRIKEQPEQTDKPKIERQLDQDNSAQSAQASAAPAAPRGSIEEGAQKQTKPSQDDEKEAIKHREAPKAKPVQSGINEVISEDAFSPQLRDSDPHSDHESKGLDEPATFDKGNRMETNSNDSTTAENMVQTIHARGAGDMRVEGSESFRREAWVEGQKRGVNVRGYVPTEDDKREVAEAKSTQPSTREQEMARKFRESPEAAVKEYKELAGAVAMEKALQKRLAQDAANKQWTRAQVQQAEATVRNNIASSIERGKLPEVKVRETHVETQHELNNDRAR